MNKLKYFVVLIVMFSMTSCLDIVEELSLKKPIFKQVFNSNNDRYLAVLPKDNKLPKNLNLTIDDVISGSLKI